MGLVDVKVCAVDNDWSGPETVPAEEIGRIEGSQTRRPGRLPIPSVCVLRTHPPPPAFCMRRQNGTSNNTHRVASLRPKDWMEVAAAHLRG